MEKVETAAPVATENQAPLSDMAYHLLNSQFQQLSTLAMASGGGALLMYQLGLFKIRPMVPVFAAVLFALAALIAFMGPVELTRGVVEGKDVSKSYRYYLWGSMFFFGVGTGLLVMGLLRNAG